MKGRDHHSSGTLGNVVFAGGKSPRIGLKTLDGNEVMSEGLEDCSVNLGKSTPAAHPHDTRFKFKHQQSQVDIPNSGDCRQTEFEYCSGSPENEHDFGRTSSGRQTKRPRHLEEFSRMSPPPSSKKLKYSEKLNTSLTEGELKKGDIDSNTSSNKTLDKGEGKPSRCSYDTWTLPEKLLFYEALSKYGKDFDKIQAHISEKLTQNKKGGSASNQLGEDEVKNKNQVRFFYYREWKKIAKYVDMPGVKKATKELYGLINFQVLWKRSIVLDGKISRKFNELIKHGSTTIKSKNRIMRFRTPNCEALPRRKVCPEVIIVENKPSFIEVLLKARDNASWSHVQGLSHNPRVKIRVRSGRRVTSVLHQLYQRWRSPDDRLRDELLNRLGNCSPSLHHYDDGDDGLEITLFPPPGATLYPFSISPESNRNRLGLDLSAHDNDISPNAMDKANNNTNRSCQKRDDVGRERDEGEDVEGGGDEAVRWRKGKATLPEWDITPRLSDADRMRKFGWCESNSGMITIGDIHLVMGEPPVLDLDYEVAVGGGGGKHRMLHNLVNTVIRDGSSILLTSTTTTTITSTNVTTTLTASGGEGGENSGALCGKCGSSCGAPMPSSSSSRRNRTPGTPYTSSGHRHPPHGISPNTSLMQTPTDSVTPTTSSVTTTIINMRSTDEVDDVGNTGDEDILAQAALCIHPSPTPPHPPPPPAPARSGSVVLLPSGHLPSPPPPPTTLPIISEIIMPPGSLPPSPSSHSTTLLPPPSSSSLLHTYISKPRKLNAKRVLIPTAPPHPAFSSLTSNSDSLTGCFPHSTVERLAASHNTDTSDQSQTNDECAQQESCPSIFGDLLEFSQLASTNSRSRESGHTTDDLIHVALTGNTSSACATKSKSSSETSPHAAGVGDPDGISIYCEDAMSPFKSFQTLERRKGGSFLLDEKSSQDSSPLKSVRSGEMTLAPPAATLHDTNSLTDALVRITTELDREVDHMLTENTSDLRSKFADLAQQLENTN